ncbi:MAG: 3-isopropylmalate dehydrogenase [Deferribacteres bacterium]|nr:3-isopropylmalate dehydrogenase [candidate division KSB1 bacterium]MCB9500297.1 3-isopropylmalate dehydrogenase [Deferribacteres bacterium]
MPKLKRIVTLPGDGIGPEVMTQGVALLGALANSLDMEFEFSEDLVGGACLREYNVPIREKTYTKCKNADAVLLGAVGLPEYDNNPSHLRPEKALLGLRGELGVYCNLRPAQLYDILVDASPLKKEFIEGLDLMVVRELCGGLYFGQPSGIEQRKNKRFGISTMTYGEDEIRRIAIKAFELARLRRGKVTSVDKANVLSVSQLWRAVVTEVAGDYPDVKLEHMLVDNCAMQLVRAPKQFDVILTENMFGDILSDEASQLTGSIGMLPSASLGDGTPMYEPVHGTAPDIAGKDKANPIAMINSVAMLLHYSFERPEAAKTISTAVETVLKQGYHTGDIQIEGKLVGTKELGGRIIEETVKNI